MSGFQETQRADLTGRRVLLAEDVPINAEIIEDILAMHGIRTDHAANGRIAAERFRGSAEGTYCAVLMDIRMPEMDGWEAAETIRALDRADAKRIPIIAITANDCEEDMRRSAAAGMNAQLGKPLDPEALLRTLEELVFSAEH